MQITKIKKIFYEWVPYAHSKIFGIKYNRGTSVAKMAVGMLLQLVHGDAVLMMTAVRWRA